MSASPPSIRQRFAQIDQGVLDAIQAGSGDRVLRLHQEDMCQALGLSPTLRYEQQGGPSQARIVGLLRRHSTSPADDIADLIDALAYSWVIGAPTVTPRTSACCSTTSATAQTPASPTCAEKVVRQAESGRIRRFAQGKMSCVPQRSHSTWRSPGRCSSPNENVARPSFAHRISYSPRAPCSLLTSPSRNHGLSPASIACRSDMNSASAAVN